MKTTDKCQHAKEALYDERIFPLMAEIIALCKAAKISMVASFELDARENDPDDPLMCTSHLLDATSSTALRRAAEVLAPHRPVCLAETIETLPNGSQRITIRRL